MKASSAAVMTVLNEQPERLRRRMLELAAQEEPLDEVIIAAPSVEHALIESTLPASVPFVLRLVDNPTGERSAGLNLAARAATADLLIRVDARSSISPRHVRACAAVLQARPDVGVVGGPQLPLAADDGVVAKGIARALANPWALGGAAYRRNAGSAAVDTVYLGAFRRTELLDLGGYDERLTANEDFELCQRYRRRGLLVWLAQDAAVAYEPRSALAAVASQYYAFGRSKARFWRLTGTGLQARQVLALAGTAGGLPVLGWALRRPSRLGGVLAAGTAGVVLVDALGATAGPVPAGVRLVALLTYPVVWGSWTLGVADETLRPQR